MISVSMMPASPALPRRSRGRDLLEGEMAGLKTGCSLSGVGDGDRRGLLEEKPVIKAGPGSGRRPTREKNQNLYET